MGKTAIFVLVVAILSFPAVSALQCYTCEYEDTNENCKGTNTIKTCSQTQDRCLTQTIWSSEREKLRIDKSCASVDSCQLAVEQLSKSYWCDESVSAWGCVSCCETDLCNLSLASGTHASCLVTMVILVIYTFVMY